MAGRKERNQKINNRQIDKRRHIFRRPLNEAASAAAAAAVTAAAPVESVAYIYIYIYLRAI